MSTEMWPTAGTAGELTTEHYGLLLSFQPPTRDGWLPPRRSMVVDELRRLTGNGRRRVEVIDFTPNGGFVGTSRMLDADTPVVIERRVRRARKRPWGVGALKPGEKWPDEAPTPHQGGGEQA